MGSTSLASIRPDESSLRRGLTSIHVVGIVVSSIVGTGIFIRSASMMQDIGTAPLLMAAWIVAGLLTLAGALSYAELCTLMPRAGGEYIFLRETFGAPAAFLFGWMRFVVGGGMTAAMAVGAATFLADAFSLPAAWWQASLAKFGLRFQLDWGPRQVIALSAIGTLAALNCRSVRASGATQTLFAGFKVAVLLVLIVAAALTIYSRGVVRPEMVVSATAGTTGGIALAILAALQAYNGWVFAAMLGGEVADFGRKYARDIIIGTGTVIALYVLINIGYVMLLTPSEIASSNSAAHPEAHGRGHWFDPSTAHHSNKNLEQFLELVSLEFGTLSCVPRNPSAWFLANELVTIPEWIKKLRSNFARACRAGRRAAKTEPRASSVAYFAKQRALRIELTNGAVITLPVKLIPSLRRAPPRDVRAVETLGRGGGLHWESLDLDLSVPGLLSSVFAGPERLAELGRVGGRKSSPAKAAAAGRNGRKGGRPRIRPKADPAES